MCGQQPPKVMGASWGKTAADLPGTPIRVTAGQLPLTWGAGGSCGVDLMWPVLLVALDWLQESFARQRLLSCRAVRGVQCNSCMWWKHICNA